MRMKCGHHEEGADPCDKVAVQGKEYCARHLIDRARGEQRAEAEVLGEATEPIREHFEQSTRTEEPRRQMPRLQQPRRATPAVDPEILGGKMAQILIARDAATRLAIARGQKPRNQEGDEIDPEREQDRSTRLPRVPFQVKPRRPRRDITRMTDPVTGKDLVPPGMIGRWVREVDGNGLPSQARVEEFKDYDYQVVMTSEGKEHRGPLGLAMMVAPEQYALRVKDYMPTGALNRDDLLADAYEAVEQSNRHAGQEVIKVVTEPEHSRRKAYHTSGVENIGEF